MSGNVCIRNFKNAHGQSGVVLIIFLLAIGLAAIAFLINTYSASQFKNGQNKVTSRALAEAKQALLAYAVEDITTAYTALPSLKCEDRNSNNIVDTGDSPYLPEGCNCGDNCRRPSDFPCSDKGNIGEAKTACLDESFRFGRFPWKTLGTEDLRDSTGERLWYALSNQYKSNPRLLPLNSQTVGGISLRNIQGELINDATTGNGVVAVVIAVNEPLTRYELNGSKTLQVRSTANINNPIHYLDVVQNLDVTKKEDNADFGELTKNGFISGVVKVMQDNQPVIISNDIVLPIYQSEVAGLSKTVVLNEVAKALKSDINILPAPSSENDLTCIGNGFINNGECKAETSSMSGFIPVSKGNDPNFIGWQTKNVNSILRGENLHNWFQQNGWRSLVKYQKNLPCLTNEKWCRNIDPQTTVRIE